MAAPIYNPRIPYCEPIPGGPLTPGRMIRIQGSTYPNADRFAINLQVGPNVNPRDDLALHINSRFSENCIVRNSLIYQNWGDEERQPNFLPFQRGTSFEILLLCEPAEYKIAVNGQHFCEFRHRMAPQNATYLSIDGDVSVTLLGFEGGSAPAPGYGAPASPYGGAAAPYGAPGGGYGAPPQPSPYGAPPSPYGAPPYGQAPPPYGAAGAGPYPSHAGYPSGGYPSGGYHGGGGAGYAVPAAAAGAAAGYGAYAMGKKAKKGKKSKLTKYGVPLAAGLGGAYVLNKAAHGIGGGFRGSGSSSSSSGSSSEEE